MARSTLYMYRKDRPVTHVGQCGKHPVYYLTTPTGGYDGAGSEYVVRAKALKGKNEDYATSLSDSELSRTEWLPNSNAVVRKAQTLAVGLLTGRMKSALNHAKAMLEDDLGAAEMFAFLASGGVDQHKNNDGHVYTEIRMVLGHKVEDGDTEIPTETRWVEYPGCRDSVRRWAAEGWRQGGTHSRKPRTEYIAKQEKKAATAEKQLAKLVKNIDASAA